MSNQDRTKGGGTGGSAGGGWRRSPGNPRTPVVREIVEEGAPIADVARVFGLALTTINDWAKRHRLGGLDALVPKPIAPPVRARPPDPGATR